MTENMIAENMIYQVNSEGHHYQVLKDISNQFTDGSALNKRD